MSTTNFSSTTTTTVSKNNLDLTHPSLDESNAEALCHILTLFPFMVDDKPIVSAYESAFVTYMAMQHLNQQIINGTSEAPEEGQIISELTSQLESCPIQFGVEFINTQYNPGRALNALMQRVIGQNEDMGQESHDESDATNSPATSVSLPSPCAVVGAYRSSTSESTATLTSFQGYPQISAMSTSSDLNDRSLYPLFGRTIPSDAGTAQVLAEYFRNVLGISHLAILAINDAFGNAYASELQKAMLQQPPQQQQLYQENNSTNTSAFLVRHISIERDGSNIPQALQALKELQYRYVFVAHFGGSDMSLNDDLLEQAYQQGLVHEQQSSYVWMFSDGIVASLAAKRLKRNSPLHMAYRGVGSIEAIGGLPGNDRYDAFAKQLLKLKQDFLDSQNIDHPLQTLLPYYDDPAHTDALSFLHDPSFLNPLTDGRVPLIYEATVLLGMAACQAFTNVTATTTSSDDEGYFLHLDGERFFNTMVNSISFEGMSGLVTLDPATGSRISNTTLFRLVNMVEEDTDADTVRLIPINSMMYSDGRWKTLQPYVYKDGTTQPPLDIPPPELQLNYVSTYTRAIALGFFTSIVILAVYFWAWTWKKRNTHIVRASQPVFLYLLCTGNIILACAIVPMTFDGSNATLRGLSIACTSAVWLIVIGVGITLSALFAKAKRINTIMHSANRFRRIKVTIRETLIPILVLLFINIVILSLMSVFHPVEYGIKVVSEDSFGRAVNTYGSCSYSMDRADITILLFLINMGLFCATIFQSCRSRNLSTEFQESQYIFRAVIGILLVAFIGVPVLIIARDNTNARLFVTSGTIFAMCLLILLFIFLPKIQYERSPHNVERTGVSSTHVSGLDIGLTCPGGLTTGFGCTSDSVHLSRPSGVFSTEDESESGEQIFSSKTKSELVEEVTALKRCIRSLTTRIETLGRAHSANIANEENDTTEILGRRSAVHFADPDGDHDDGNSSTVRLSDDELLCPSEVGGNACIGHDQEETSPHEVEGPDATCTQHQDPESCPLSEAQP